VDENRRSLASLGTFELIISVLEAHGRYLIDIVIQASKRHLVVYAGDYNADYVVVINNGHPTSQCCGG
jgi:hypothetical protein